MIGDCSEERLGIAFLELGQHEQCGEVGAEVEEVFRRDLAGHDGLCRTGLFGVGREFAELSDPQPTQVVHQAGQCRIGLVLERGGAKAFHPLAAGSLGELERIVSVPGDDEKRIGRAQRAGFSGGWRITARVFSVQCWVFRQGGGRGRPPSRISGLGAHGRA